MTVKTFCGITKNGKMCPLCNSNADIERLNEETIIGLRPNKAAVEECGGVNKVSTTQDLLKAATNSQRLYTEHLREENAKKTERS